MADDQNWRLKAQVATPVHAGALEALVDRIRHTDLGGETGREDVVVTHDGQLLFAYAASEDTLKIARAAFAAALGREGLDAELVESHFDDGLDDWRQIDPPLSGQAAQREDALERDAKVQETRTLIASAGKLERAELEQSMREWAEQLNLELTITEHRHLLTCQVLFEVTGARRKIDEFDEGLKAEELQTIRSERMVMMSPL